MKLIYESREAVIKLFDDSSSIISEAKYKAIHGKGISSKLARVARIAKVSNRKVSNRKFSTRKVSDNSNIKILSPKQMLQRLVIALHK